jgi:WD40 repeat protein
VAYSPDGKLLATSHAEPPGVSDGPGPPPPELPRFHAQRAVRIWDAQTGVELRSINHGAYTRRIIFCPDGKRLAGAVLGNFVKMWDTATGEETLVLTGHTGEVSDLDISRDGKRVVTGSRDGTVKVWDSGTGACLQTRRVRADGVDSVSWSPDATRVASVGAVGDTATFIVIWDLASEKEVLRLDRRTLIGRVAFSPDGERLVSFSNVGGKATSPGLVEVWNASSGKLLFSRKAHSDALTCIAYSPDGRRLASGSDDGTVIVRDAVTGEEVLSLAVHRDKGGSLNPIVDVAFSPDGKRLATASEYGAVTIWDVEDTKLDN